MYLLFEVCMLLEKEGILGILALQSKFVLEKG